MVGRIYDESGHMLCEKEEVRKIGGKSIASLLQGEELCTTN